MEGIKMLSAQTRFLVTAALLVTLVSAVLTAILINSSRPNPISAPPQQVLSLAASSTSNTVTVVGAGTASGVPDAAELDLGVSATRPNVRDAVSQATADMNHLLSAIRGQGVQDKDIQTASISIYQQTNCCPQTVIGYTSSNSLTIKVHHVSNVTAIMEAAIDAVGNDLQMNGIILSVSDPTAMNKSARAAAMSDANARAQDWAGLTGHHVGGLIGVSEIIAAAPAQVCQGGCGKGSAGGVPIQPGQTTITVTVAATYELVT
jgi:uncharacterized protein YggE